MGIPTSITLYILSEYFTPYNGQTATVTFAGTISPGFAGATIQLYYEDPEDSGVWVSLGSETTNASGYFGKIVEIPFGVPRTLRATFGGDATYDPSEKIEETDIWGRGRQNLSSYFWVTHYPKPEDIEVDTYGYVLCIDPNGLRSTAPGPLFLLLDNATIKPGLTDRNGVMAAFINDNERYIDEGPYKDEVMHWDMYLLRDGTSYIRDEDEFWIGIQRGPYDPSNDPENDAWAPLGGNDGKGSGRRWLMGGYITKRYYVYDENTRITAVIRGKDYMDLWQDQPFGTSDIPRNYTTATDFAQIADDVLTDVNITTGLGTISPFTQHPEWWPGNGTVPTTTGVTWVKEFREEASNNVMRQGAEQAGYEWQITFKKQVMLYPRASGPIVAQPLVQFDRNIRSIPEIVMGETGDLITNVIVAEGESLTVPPEIDGWALNPKDWPDISNPNRTYSAVSFPAPPNVSRNLFSDQTLTFDDQGHPALCFIKDQVSQFNLALSFYSDAAGNPEFASLALDLRKYRRVKLRFRHATRDPVYEYGGGAFTTGTIYRILLKNDLGTGYYYDFGKGTANPANQSPQLINGHTDYDIINDQNWNEIELLLPEPDVDGVVSDANLKGWIRIGGYTGNICNYPEISVYPAEPNPGPYGPSMILGSNIVAGDEYISISSVERLAGYPPGSSASNNPFTQTVEIIAKQGATEETLPVKSIKGTYFPAGKNTLLDVSAQNSFTAGSTTLYIRVGWTIAFSQFRFERALKYSEEAISPLGPPYRYKIISRKEIEYLTEAESHAAIELAQLASAKQWVKVNVDGDPRILIGYRMVTHLDPNHSKVFQNTPMIIDDLEYMLENQTDFNIELLLAPSNAQSKARSLTDATAFDTLFRKALNLESTKELTKGAT